jgi:hypothetical protein
MGVYHHLTHALRIIRTVQPKDWPAALESLPAESRPECEAYLRTQAQLLRMRRRYGSPSVISPTTNSPTKRR